MNTRFHGDGTATVRVTRVVDRAARRLDTQLASFADDLTLLDVSTERHRRDGSFTARVVLSLPDAKIPASGGGLRREVAVREAFDDLFDRVEVYLARLRDEPSIRRESKRHRDKAELAARAVAAATGWPSDPPATADEAATWGVVTFGTSRR
jgi:hypothetical protein